ncbi:MAG: hypothetical protein AUJ98_00620 [Bacteroidetes bacterium CG2_30_33_31]|nr:MAG: hypothetical protein AUJ98_00620 [Bacteroidetes bacterium CG2_30_33_31]
MKERETRKWHVLYVRSRHEKVVNEELKESGFITYLPMVKVLKQWSQRKKWIEEAVFKSYIFIKSKRSELYDALRNPNAISYIKFAGEPAIVSEKTLELIQQMIESKTSFEVESGQIAIGKKITLKVGIFKGQEGKVVQLRGKKKLVIRIDSINSNIVINLDDIMPPEKL